MAARDKAKSIDSSLSHFSPEPHLRIPSSTPYGDRHKTADTDNNLCESQDSGFSSQSSLNHVSTIDEFSSDINTTSETSFKHGNRKLQVLDGKLKMQKYLEQINKEHPIDNQIGRRCGEKHMDIIAELWLRKIPCLENILKALGPRELRRCAQVCLKWRRIIKSHKLIEVRLLKAEKRRDAEKENPSPEKDEQSSVISTSTTPLRTKFNQQFSPHVETSDNSSDASNYNQFYKAALKLTPDERLMKCVKCLAPAKVVDIQQRGLCTSKDCSFDFCTLCMLSYHKSSKCKVSRPSATNRQELEIIGSKKSKARLKRL